MTQNTAEPKSIKVHQTAGTGMDIEWKDGHASSYSFVFLRDACPCALCNEEREKDGRQPGDPLKPIGAALPMFKALARPTKVEPVGKYAIRFVWNDAHEHGIYSWDPTCASIAPAPSAKRTAPWRLLSQVPGRIEKPRR